MLTTVVIIMWLLFPADGSTNLGVPIFVQFLKLGEDEVPAECIAEFLSLGYKNFGQISLYMGLVLCVVGYLIAPLTCFH